MRIPSGSTDRYVYFVAVDATDLKTRETGLSSFTVYRSRNGAAAAAMTTPTVNETDATNMEGVYELLADEDTTIAAGNDEEEMVFHITHAGMAPVTRVVELYRPKATEGNTATLMAGGGLEVASFTSGAIDDDALDSTALAVIADKVLDELLSEHTISGSLSAEITAIKSLVNSATITTNSPVDPSSNAITIIRDATYTSGSKHGVLNFAVTKDYTGGAWSGTLTVKNRDVTITAAIISQAVVVASSTLLTVALDAADTAMTALTTEGAFGEHRYDIQMTDGTDVDKYGPYLAHLVRDVG